MSKHRTLTTWHGTLITWHGNVTGAQRLQRKSLLRPFPPPPCSRPFFFLFFFFFLIRLERSEHCRSIVFAEHCRSIDFDEVQKLKPPSLSITRSVCACTLYTCLAVKNKIGPLLHSLCSGDKRVFTRAYQWVHRKTALSTTIESDPKSILCTL